MASIILSDSHNAVKDGIDDLNKGWRYFYDEIKENIAFETYNQIIKPYLKEFEEKTDIDTAKTVEDVTVQWYINHNLKQFDKFLSGAGGKNE